MSLLLAIIIASALFCFVWWLIGYAAPPDLVKPLRILAAALFLVWLIMRLWPLVAV